MNRRLLTRTLIAVGVLAVVGTAGAQAYYTHQLAERVAARDAAPWGEITAPAAHPMDPWAAMDTDIRHMQAQMDRMLNAAFRDVPAAGWVGQPGDAKVTLNDKGDDYVVKAVIPGAKKSDINVNLDGRLLSISSQSQGAEKQKADNGRVIRQEDYASSFQQAFTLPGPVNAAGMKTQFEDGKLTVTIPKATS